MDARPIATLDAPTNHPQVFWMTERFTPSPHLSFPPGRFGLIRADRGLTINRSRESFRLSPFRT